MSVARSGCPLQLVPCDSFLSGEHGFWGSCDWPTDGALAPLSTPQRQASNEDLAFPGKWQCVAHTAPGERMLVAFRSPSQEKTKRTCVGPRLPLWKLSFSRHSAFWLGVPGAVRPNQSTVSLLICLHYNLHLALFCFYKFQKSL